MQARAIGMAIVVGGLFLPFAVAAGQDDPTPSFSFGVIADIQYADKETVGERYYRDALRNLETCVLELKKHDLAFTIQLGDIIDGNETPEKTRLDLDRVLAVYQKLNSPIYHVIGNHCLTAGKECLHDVLKLESFYYDFTPPRVNGWRCIVLDGNDAGYGVLSDRQLEWFRGTLARAFQNRERVIVFNHFALLKEAAKDHRMKTPDPVIQCLDAYPCVVAYLAGHDHAGGYALREGIHHITLRGMVEAPSLNAYAIFTVFPTRIEEAGFGEEPSRELQIFAMPGEE